MIEPNAQTDCDVARLAGINAWIEQRQHSKRKGGIPCCVRRDVVGRPVFSPTRDMGHAMEAAEAVADGENILTERTDDTLLVARIGRHVGTGETIELAICEAILAMAEKKEESR